MKQLLAYIFLVSWVILSCHKNKVVIQDAGNPISKIKIVTVLGSSTAAGTGANPIDSSWVNKLIKQLTDDHRNVNVINLAKGGFTTYNVLPSGYKSSDTARNITKALSYNPNLVII